MNEKLLRKRGGGGGGEGILLIPNSRNRDKDKTDVLYLTGRTEDLSKSVTDWLVDRSETAKDDSDILKAHKYKSLDPPPKAC